MFSGESKMVEGEAGGKKGKEKSKGRKRLESITKTFHIESDPSSSSSERESSV